ncbi:E3 ubiquitin-protein ligase E3D [Erpetoichthys calabaricus]|uniref:E3 ubiquitin-protein ligase E3D n=1 Tax=Erpetoichthys calabaricus TaxID=27687 RepID=A0A8C4RIX1_ERPCA|nr:E3 ubiquitin-protein ligase E3D [Erpetoichthys calabaricus]
MYSGQLNTMSDSATQSDVFMEIRKKLQSCLLVLSGTLAKEPSDVEISTRPPSWLQIRTSDFCCIIELPAEVSITLPLSRELPKIEEDGLYMRLHVQNNDNAEVLPSLIISLKAQKSYVLACQSCGNVIVFERTFHRVLPLPSGNWNALVEDWCCHPDPFANKKLLPKEEDCLLGDTFILLSWHSVVNEALVKNSEKADSQQKFHENKFQKSKEVVHVTCQRCRRVLGESVSSDTVKLYITELIVKSPTNLTNHFDMENRYQFVENAVACRLLEISSVYSTFRFSIQGHDGKILLLLWLLNTDTLLVSSSKTAADTAESDLFTDNSITKHHSHKARNVIKILYLHCLTSTHHDVIEAWEKDIGVQPLTLPVETCHELIHILSTSNATLPSSMRTFQTFQVAFLKLRCKQK